MQTKLAIAIPTYNRAEILSFNLMQILDQLIEFKIPVYISDDSTNEDTANAIEELKNKHSLFYYFKNNPSLGHDFNCLKTINLVKEEYVWYMGDSMIIKNGSIKKILDIISINGYDFISCNAEGRNLNKNSKVYSDGIELMNDLGWHLTMTGATIYNTTTILNFNKKEIKGFKNFPQLALIFQKFAQSNSSLYWINEKMIYVNFNKKSYWSNKVFEVFITDFKNLAQNLSEMYPSKLKDQLVLQHSLITGIFNYHSFVIYRINNIFNKSVFFKYNNDFRKFTGSKSFLLYVISIFPVRILKFMYRIVYNMIKTRLIMKICI